MARSFDQEGKFTVLLEQVRTEVRMVAEGLVSMDQKFERRFEAVERRMDTGFSDVRTAIAATNRRLDEVNEGLSSRLDKTNQRLDETNQRVDKFNQDLNQRLDETNQRLEKVNLDLNRRLDGTNSRLDNLVDRFDTHIQAHAG